jgi:transposase-like protein
MKCPKCFNELKQVGITGSGHSLYLCVKPHGCGKKWSIREESD